MQTRPQSTRKLIPQKLYMLYIQEDSPGKGRKAHEQGNEAEDLRLLEAELGPHSEKSTILWEEYVNRDKKNPWWRDNHEKGDEDSTSQQRTKWEMGMRKEGKPWWRPHGWTL